MTNTILNTSFVPETPLYGDLTVSLILEKQKCSKNLAFHIFVVDRMLAVCICLCDVEGWLICKQTNNLYIINFKSKSVIFVKKKNSATIIAF